VSGGEELQRELPCTLLIASTKVMGPLPHRRLDKLERDFAAGKDGLERARSPTVLEATARALLGHGLRSLDPSTVRVVRLNPSAQREHVDTLFRTGANGRNIDRIDEPGCCTVLELDNGESTVDTGINAEDPHDAPPNKLSWT
jgi:hypothetical protein